MKTKNSLTIQRNNSAIQKLVERGYALHLEIAARSEELEDIKDLLKSEAQARPHEHVPLASGSEGEQWIASTRQAECRIVFPAPRLVSLLDPKESGFETIKTLCGDHFDALFRKLTLFRIADKEHFRNQVKGKLSSAEATRLLDLCSSPVEPRATWKERTTPKKEVSR
jgi:hypothetical protein